MITLYDIPSKLPEKAWSPNTFKARISLNYKGVPYKTEWVEYPDIEPTMKRLGGAPTSKKSDGHERYTLPAIHDPATGKIITDSTKIAEYLDETYPDKPLLFPLGTRAAIATLEHVFMQANAKVAPILRLGADKLKILNPPSQVFFRSTQEQIFGKRFEDLAPPLGSPARDAMWKGFKEDLDKLAAFYDKNGEGKQFYFSDTFTFADVVLVAYLVRIKIVLGAESDEWKALGGWSDERWSKLVESTKHLQVVN